MYTALSTLLLLLFTNIPAICGTGDSRSLVQAGMEFEIDAAELEKSQLPDLLDLEASEKAGEFRFANYLTPAELDSYLDNPKNISALPDEILKEFSLNPSSAKKLSAEKIAEVQNAWRAIDPEIRKEAIRASLLPRATRVRLLTEVQVGKLIFKNESVSTTLGGQLFLDGLEAQRDGFGVLEVRTKNPKSWQQAVGDLHGVSSLVYPQGYNDELVAPFYHLHMSRLDDESRKEEIRAYNLLRMFIENEKGSLANLFDPDSETGFNKVETKGIFRLIGENRIEQRINNQSPEAEAKRLERLLTAPKAELMEELTTKINTYLTPSNVMRVSRTSSTAAMEIFEYIAARKSPEAANLRGIILAALEDTIQKDPDLRAQKRAVTAMLKLMKKNPELDTIEARKIIEAAVPRLKVRNNSSVRKAVENWDLIGELEDAKWGKGEFQLKRIEFARYYEAPPHPRGELWNNLLGDGKSWEMLRILQNETIEDPRVGIVLLDWMEDPIGKQYVDFRRGIERIFVNPSVDPLLPDQIKIRLTDPELFQRLTAMAAKENEIAIHILRNSFGLTGEEMKNILASASGDPDKLGKGLIAMAQTEPTGKYAKYGLEYRKSAKAGETARELQNAIDLSCQKKFGKLDPR